MHTKCVQFAQNEKKAYTFMELSYLLLENIFVCTKNNSMPFDSFFTYLSYSTRDESWKMFSTTVGRVSVEPGGAYPYQADKHPPEYTQNWQEGRILNEYQCIYISDGYGNFHCMGKEFRISPGTMILLIPGMRHWYAPDPETGWTEHWVGLRGEYVDELSYRGFISPQTMVRDAGYHQSFICIYNEIIELAKLQRSGFQQVIAAQIMLLLSKTDYYTNKNNRFQNHELEMIERAKVMFQEHLFSTLDIESMAESMLVSYKYFRELFKSYTGLSPYQFFLQMKINKAKELLSEGNFSVKEVSFKLAFDNPYYFSRLFKKKTGVSPSKWNGNRIPTDLDFLE